MNTFIKLLLVCLLSTLTKTKYLNEIADTQYELIIPPVNLLKGLSLPSKLEKVEIKLDVLFWHSLAPNVESFNQGKWGTFGIQVNSDLSNCSKMSFNIPEKYFSDFF